MGYFKEPGLFSEFKGNNLKSNFKQEFKIPFKFNGEEAMIYVEYEYAKNGKLEERSLDIIIPDIATPTEVGSGIYAFFKRYRGLKLNHEIKGSKDYYHNKKLAEIFINQIKPVLKKTLPYYMNKLIQTRI